MKIWQAAALTLSAAIASTASAYQVSGSKWQDGKFRLYVGVPATVPQLDFDNNPITWNFIIQQAVVAWDNPVQGLDITIIDETRNPCDGYTGAAGATVPNPVINPNASNPTRDSTTATENGIGLDDDVCGSAFGSDVFAVTLLRSVPNQPALYQEADIIFNSNFQYDIHNNSFSSSATPGTVTTPLDARRLAIKQLGFALGLIEEPNIPSIMHPNAATRSITNPTTDDLQGMRILYPNPVASTDPDIRLAVEEPNDSQIKSGISNIRGWAIGLKDIRLVELSIDGGAFQPVPYGSVRSDVASTFSQYPKSGNSGFSMIFNWSSLSNGQHQISVRAHDVDDNVVTVNRSFTVARFNDSFIDNVNIAGSSSISNQKTVTLNNVNADNVNYTVKLEWDNAAQKFNVVSTQAE